MRFIGLLGALALLGLAWAISYHRRDVRMRCLLGLGLQFLFALIILREDVWSFIGMGVVGGLAAVYQLRTDTASPDRSYGLVALFLAAAIAVAVVLGSARFFDCRSWCPCHCRNDACERSLPVCSGGAGTARCPVGGRLSGLACRIRTLWRGDLRSFQFKGFGVS